jgi:cell division protein FtsI/penicillin-binding protein 2
MPSDKGIRNIFAQVVLLVIVAAFVALAGRIVYIHRTMGKELKLRTDHQQQAFRPLPAIRGTIYDRRGRRLAGTKIVPSLFADPNMIEDKLSTADIVANQLGMDPETVITKIDHDPDSQFVWLERGISMENADALTKPAIRKRLPGLGILWEPKRIYTSGNLAGHVLGAVNIDGLGQEGIELYYNHLLGGQNGYEKYMQDAKQRKIWLIKSQCKSPVNGQHIILSIDSVVQQFTQKILTATCEYYKSESGVAIVMDPKTGDILAMASYPEVDPNNFGKTPADVRRNRGITDPFEPGSIYKPFIASHALEQKVVRFDESIFCENGAYTVGKRTLHDSHGHGSLTFPEIVQLSSNIGMAKLGQRLGNLRLYNAVRAFGFGSRTGLDLKGEDGGIVIPFRRWTSFSTLSVPMGQEIACTSLQLVRAFAAIANEGKLVTPRLFRMAIDERGQITKERTEVEVEKQAILPETAKIMVEQVLRGTCVTGTGKKADIPGYQIFGKTGTAQIARATSKGKGRYEENAYVGSFLGGAPSSNPQVVVGVNIRRPVKSIGYYGGTVAAPAVKEILQAYFDYQHIPPFEKVDTSKAGESAGGD